VQRYFSANFFSCATKPGQPWLYPSHAPGSAARPLWVTITCVPPLVGVSSSEPRCGAPGRDANWQTRKLPANAEARSAEFTMMFDNFAGACSAALSGSEQPAAAGACVHFPLGDFKGFPAAPLQRLLALDQGSKDASGRAAISISVTTESLSGVILVVAMACSSMDCWRYISRCRSKTFFHLFPGTVLIFVFAACLVSLTYSASTNVFRLVRFIFQKVRY